MENIRIEDLTFAYPNTKSPALSGLTLSVKQGEFIVLCGPSGCGKSTLLRHLKPSLTPYGVRRGGIFFNGQPLDVLSLREESSQIGFVLQNPDSQIVTDKVWHELAFGLESLGTPTSTIRMRTAEISSFFGIESWFHKNVAELSGGQKQLLNLAAVMAMQPSLLILDEPTSQLDPIAASDFLAAVSKINRDLGTTVILTEHRLEEALPLADRVFVMDAGKLYFEGTAKSVGENLKHANHDLFAAMPVPMRVHACVKNDLPCPVTIREGRTWLDVYAAQTELLPILEKTTINQQKEPVVSLDQVWFRYEKKGADVLKGLSLDVYSGEIFAMLGGNGAGKSTMLSILAGMSSPFRGFVKTTEHVVGMLPQNPQALFTRKTVYEELWEMVSEKNLEKHEKEHQITSISRLCQLEQFLQQHPYDLSGGEQQRTALAKVLLMNPDVLLLDEPTKGMDAAFKKIFAGILSQLTEQGITVLMVSHDVEFCASHAHRCALLFDGIVVSGGTPREFFAGNGFYTTAASRMARHHLPDAVTAEDIILACHGMPPEPPTLPVGWKDGMGGTPPIQPQEKQVKTPLWRKIGAGAVALSFLFTLKQFAANYQGILALISGGDLAVRTFAGDHVWRYVLIMACFVIEACLLFWLLREKTKVERIPVFAPRSKLSARTYLALLMGLVAVPITIFVGIYYLDDRKYYFISLLILLEAMFPFILVFESRKPQARELIVISTLCAIAVAGRAAFFMLPQFKPVIAIVVIAGVAFGAEAGFFVGAITAFVSNMFFGQGPWTPWQMLAFGLIGFLAGLLFQKRVLRRSKVVLCLFGFLSAILIYGGLINPASVLMFQPHPTKEMFLLSYIQGIPFDLIHGAATVLFLWILAEPMLEKLERVKVKYGLLEQKAIGKRRNLHQKDEKSRG